MALTALVIAGSRRNAPILVWERQMLHDCLRRGCRHKNVILIVTNGSKKACLKVMKKEQVVDQKLLQLADFPLLCTHSGKF